MIKVENISKVFNIPHEKTRTLFHKLTGVFQSSYRYEEFYALKDVSFNVQKGEFVGMVGRNGSGKTTLLRIIAGIYRPTTGIIIVNDQITPLLEIGIGFQGDFSCRENIYINGALLGFSRQEMKKRFEEIIAFAELEKFIDIKLNRLSTGMQVRLAFAIAIQSDSPILLVDEVMAVGDSNFQKKCRDVFMNFKKNGRTILFVSHDLNSVAEYCDRVLVIEQGELIKEGNSNETIKYYMERVLKQ